MVATSMLSVFSVAAFAAFTLAAPSSPATVPHLTRSTLKSYHPAPSGFIKRGAAPQSATIELKLAIRQSNMEQLQRRTLEISTPGHPDYGRHYSKEELERLTAPSEASMSAVIGWLESFGVRENQFTKHAGDWVSFIVPISVAEQMLGTSYSVYEDIETGHQLLRTESYHLPEGLHAHIDVVQPTNYFGTMHKQKSNIHSQGLPQAAAIPGSSSPAPLATPAGCSSSLITAACLRALYTTSGYVPAATSKNRVGIAGYLGEYAAEADLHTFLSRYRTDANSNFNFTITVLNNGPYNQADPGGEASLDVQAVAGISYPTPITYYSSPGSPPFIPDRATPTNTNEPYLNFTSYQLSLADNAIPYVITTSYGDDEQTVPQDYALRVCDAFSQMAARGQSLFFSSGDSGVGSSSACVSNTNNSTKIFLPAFPASCPYVTAVGATVNFSPETPTTWSGAGFSNYFARPSFQNTVVPAYVSSVVKTNYAGLYNPAGRAYPDIAAQGQNFAIYVGGVLNAISGTSASAPAAAAVFGLLNDVQLAAGKAPLGWLNPWLYSTAKTGFNDLTTGSSTGCGTNGFAAAAGWDASTGWGTPDFVKLRALLP